MLKDNYVDSSFRTSNSNSERDFSIELPRSFSVPDGVVAHADDIVIPACWTTIGERNPSCYFTAFSGATFQDRSFTVPTNNYDSVEFATAPAAQLNEAAAAFSPQPVLSESYDILQNILVVSLSDSRSSAAKAKTPLCLKV